MLMLRALPVEKRCASGKIMLFDVLEPFSCDGVPASMLNRYADSA
jgi:hypothetical protein